MPATPVEPIVSPREPVVSNEIPLVNDEQNKFVNFNGIVGEEKQPQKEIVNNVSNNEASFDSIFNQMPTNLQTQEPVVETPVGSEPVIQSMPNSIVSNEIPVQQSNETMQMADPIVQTIQPNPQSIVSSVSEPVITNIPDSDILEAPTSETIASNVTSNIATTQVNNNNFIEVIRLIRNCANQIEKLGYKIDLDEIDLGNMYQASFKIDKQ